MPANGQASEDGDVVWQARSCIGEAGWTAIDTCVAMTYVHLERAEMVGVSWRTMTIRYSRAVRRPTRRPWIFEMPRRFPRPRPYTERHWHENVSAIEDVRAGARANPCPRAMHYGGAVIDAGNLDPAIWERHPCLPESPQAFYRRRRR